MLSTFFFTAFVRGFEAEELIAPRDDAVVLRRLNQEICAPVYSVQVGAYNADVGGCGLQGCHERYGLQTVQDCARRCLDREDCNAYTWAGLNGDRNHQGVTVCTMYSNFSPTSTWGPSQVFCKMQPRVSCDPGRSVQVGAYNADVGGCGLQNCNDRYGLRTGHECALRCEAFDGCNAYTWAGRNGDQNHLGETVCTLYSNVSPTSTWAPSQVFCRLQKRATCDTALSVQVGAYNADVGGCGLQNCNDRYDLRTVQQCAQRCKHFTGCNSYTWADLNGDQNHLGERVCTLYGQYEPTSTWAPSQIMCKMVAEPEQGFCVLDNGADQNAGVIKLDSGNGNSVERQMQCYQQCAEYAQSNRVTGCELIFDQGNQGCYVHTAEIARGNGVARHHCWVFPETGFCVRADGSDQNNGVIKLDALDGNSATRQAQCYEECANYERAQGIEITGCELIWNQGNRGCYVHTDVVARGNGVGNHFCWIKSVPEPEGCSAEDLSGVNLQDTNAMRAAGWTFSNTAGHPEQWEQNNQGVKNICTQGFFGWKGASQVGTMSYKLKGSGKLTIEFGDCWRDAGSYVGLYLAGNLKAQAQTNSWTTVVLDYSNGDVLELKDEGTNSVINILSISAVSDCYVPEPEQGFCVLANGADQNSGVVKLDSGNGNSVARREECYKKCADYGNTNTVTGCELIWDQGNRGCYAHTAAIARGNGVPRHYCWVN